VIAGPSHNEAQAGYFDSVDHPEFETDRPHNQPRFYQYLMRYKFRRAVDLLGTRLAGKRVLSLCCGSGMDAEFLAREGARVVALDISLGALRRARERGSRHGVEYQLVRADGERLPFAAATFDYAFVHDGLHHLKQPEQALAEMARGTRTGLIITEPADARLTRLAVRAGQADRYEEAGNYVLRFTRQGLERSCRSLGFTRTRSARYLVKYGHPPPRWWRLFDAAPAFALARAGFRLFGVILLGRWGNKLAFSAERAEA